MYSLAGYGDMITDAPRMAAYRAALSASIRPGDDVLDLGCGPGVLAALACRMGAGRVLAVEPDNILALGRDLAEANGFGVQIRFINALSTKIEPPFRCRVAVSDLRGVLPLFTQHIPSIVDLRRRWLADGGVQIPQEDRLFAALVQSPKAYGKHFGGWLDDLDGLDFAAARRAQANTTSKARLVPDDLLTEPLCWAHLDYRTIESPDCEGTVGWTIDRPGAAHGMAMWFESVLAPGVAMSNRPGEPPMIYGQLFFPWPRPVDLQPGDRVEVQVNARLLEEDYVWMWNTSIRPRAGDPLEFRQSTFQGGLWTKESLSQLSLTDRPALNSDGRAAAWVLQQMDGRRSREDIVAGLSAEFPAMFADPKDALRLVNRLQTQYAAPRA